MGLGVTDANLDWESQEEAKRFVIEQTLTQAFDPFVALQTHENPAANQKAVITYAVHAGDTLSEIANRYGISLHDLIEENRITNPNVVGVGLKLLIRREEIEHMVQRGETLEQIAGRYAVSQEAIIQSNPLVKMLANQLYTGQTLKIPVSQRSTLMASAPLRKHMAQAASRSRTRGRQMSWPVESATITSGFGARWGNVHKGIDLWNQQKANTPILAAKEGTVIEAGANRAGYGNMVVLDHGDGLQTYYAHMRRIDVSIGEEVERGQMLGLMGKTGNSTDYHLHFEVRQNDIPVNPLTYLTK